jgi:competence protein ComEC
MLLPVTVAFLAGLVGGSLFPYVPFSLLLLLLLAGLLLAVLEHRRLIAVSYGTILYGSLLFGLLYWTVFGWMSAERPLAEQAGAGPVRIVGSVVEPVRVAPGRVAMVLAVSVPDAAGRQPIQGRLRVTWRDPDQLFRQGDLVELTARVRPPAGTLNPGGFDYAAYLRRRSIDAVASVSGAGQVRLLASPPPVSWWTPWRVIDGWRDRIHQAADRTLSGSALGVYLAIIIGQPDYLAADIRDAFMATGTVHILSISGSHLGLIALLSFFMIRNVCRHLPVAWLQALSRRVTPTRLAAALTVLPVTFYALLAGAEIATVRSLVMILLFLLAVWLGREEDLLTALAAAALLLLLHDPRALFDISFQLSFCSVLAIALVLRHLRSREEDLPSQVIGERGARWLRGYLWITGGVTIATVPLVAYHFNQIAWLGLVANMLIIPLAGFILVPLGLGAAVGVLLTGQDRLPLGGVMQAGLDGMEAVIRLLAKVPGAEWHVASPSILAIVTFYAACLLAVRAEGRRAVRGLCGGLIVLLLAWWIWSPRGAADGETLRVTFLDVGQGDACVLELPDGQTVLIDAGAAYDTLDMGRTVVNPFLWDRGVHRLDHVIATHPQLDHIGGLDAVLRAFPVGRYWSNGVRRNERFYERLEETVQRSHLVERPAYEGQVIVETAQCRLQSLNPPRTTGAVAAVENGSMLNNLSVMTRLDCGPHAFLFTADAEVGALVRLTHRPALAQAGVVKVPHHGARSSFEPEWIRQSRATVAVVSVGRSNPYGHPDREVLTAYARDRIRLFRTDRDGAVTVLARMSSPEVEIRTARGEMLEPVRLGSDMWLLERTNLARLGRHE